MDLSACSLLPCSCLPISVGLEYDVATKKLQSRILKEHQIIFFSRMLTICICTVLLVACLPCLAAFWVWILSPHLGEDSCDWKVWLVRLVGTYGLFWSICHRFRNIAVRLSIYPWCKWWILDCYQGIIRPFYSISLCKKARN